MVKVKSVSDKNQTVDQQIKIILNINYQVEHKVE